MQFRKTFIVNKKFQYNFIFRYVLLLMVCFFIIFVGVKIWESRQTDKGFLLRPPTNEDVIKWAKENNISERSPEFASAFITQAKVYTFFDLLAKPLIILILINLILLIIFNVRYSNKIAGPLFRIKRDIERKIRGEEIKPIKLRKKDEFQELADSVNRLIFGNDFDKNNK